jgi:hypothetical protein
MVLSGILNDIQITLDEDTCVVSTFEKKPSKKRKYDKPRWLQQNIIYRGGYIPGNIQALTNMRI